MLIGYGRVSKEDQNLDAQKDELKAAGCDKIYTDKVRANAFIYSVMTTG